MKTVRLTDIDGAVLMGQVEELVVPDNTPEDFRCSYVADATVVQELLEYAARVLDTQQQRFIRPGQDYYLYLGSIIDPVSMACLAYEYNILSENGNVVGKMPAEVFQAFTVALETPEVKA